MRTQLREKPIIFDAESVRAILEGRKSMTRRVVKPQPDPNGYDYVTPTGFDKHPWHPDAISGAHRCPYPVGTRLWVRETWYYDIPPHKLPSEKPADFDPDALYYRADGECCQQIPECSCGEIGKPRWRSPIHMPKWAARLWLEVATVRVERVQDMGGADLVAEGGEIICDGCEAPGYRIGDGPMCDTPSEAFADRWDSINAHRPGCSWESNPWVWVIDFKRMDMQGGTS